MANYTYKKTLTCILFCDSHSKLKKIRTNISRKNILIHSCSASYPCPFNILHWSEPDSFNVHKEGAVHQEIVFVEESIRKKLYRNPSTNTRFVFLDTNSHQYTFWHNIHDDKLHACTSRNCNQQTKTSS